MYQNFPVLKWSQMHVPLGCIMYYVLCIISYYVAKWLQLVVGKTRGSRFYEVVIISPATTTWSQRLELLHLTHAAYSFPAH